MVRRLIEWSVSNPLIVVLLALALAAVGVYSFIRVNVEAYPDPAPAIIEVIAQYPGASAEEVERRVTIPLETALAGMPDLKYTRSKSLAGLSHLRNQFEYGHDFNKARQEVLNRLTKVEGLPEGVKPDISPMTPTGELFRYTLANPRDSLGRELPIYTLNDLKAVQDWTLEKQFRRVPRIIDVVSFGGTVKRYEIHPDADQLRKYGLTLQQVLDAIGKSNSNTSGDIVVAGQTAQNVRGIGLIGGGLDPMQSKEVVGLKDDNRVQLAQRAAAYLRVEDERRIREIRDIVITSVNNLPVRVEDVVEGGPLLSSGEPVGVKGVVVSHQTRLGKFGVSRPRRNAQGRPVLDSSGRAIWDEEEDKVQGVILMRKYEETLPALAGVKAKVKELNENPGLLLPGTQLEPHFDVTGLISVTTETVQENLLVGMVLVTVILLMFLSNVRSALIVAINIPLALLFAFSVLFVRGKSANLLSIGAVDFGIIVDSTVIMVENIYRKVSLGEHSELPLQERIIRASTEVERSLFFSTIIMVCALLPLFTMTGPEGQIFGPMADTYAFALGGALLLALTVSPVLCLVFFKRLKPAQDNFLVRWLKAGYLWQLHYCLKWRWLTVAVFGLLIAATVGVLPFLGHEFMPELEEGNVYIRGTFPVNISLEETAARAKSARAIIRQFPEVELVTSQVGRPDDGTDPTGFSNAEFHVPLKPEKEWPHVQKQEGWRAKLFGPLRPRTKPELIEEMQAQLRKRIPGVDWNFSQYIRDNVMESLSGVKGDNSIKIIGPDLDELERLAEEVKRRISKVQGIKDAAIFRIKGQSNLEFRQDPKKCQYWGATASDVNNVIAAAVGGQSPTKMTEGEKTFDITLRWPEQLRGDETAILKIPVDITNNTVAAGPPTSPQSPWVGPSTGPNPLGSSTAPPALYGSALTAALNNFANAPRRPLRDLVTPVDDQGRPNPGGQYTRPGASTIYREQGLRFIAVKFSVRERDLGGAVAEAQRQTQDLFQSPYRAEWSGEFQEMEEADARLLKVFSFSMVLIVILLFLAFRSILDAAVVLSNVVAMSLGGVWALLVTGTNFNISAAVGFISILGVAVMNGLLLVSAFNALRAQGRPLPEALVQGVAKLVRPVAMTALAALFGLLPAALSTRIGSQSQRPLAIVVVGGMIATLLLTNVVPVLYSFYGRREPSPTAGGISH